MGLCSCQGGERSQPSIGETWQVTDAEGDGSAFDSGAQENLGAKEGTQELTAQVEGGG